MLLDVKEVIVHYGKIEAVKGVSLDVAEGEIVTLLGSNGAGKTTLLSTISGLKRPTKGEICFDGKRIDKMHPWEIVKLGIGHVPEGRGLFPYMTVEDNLVLGAFSRPGRKEIKQNLDVAYKYFPILKQRARQRAFSMSGGEQQMVAIGRALMCRPRLLLLDEPSLGLSPIMVEQIAAIVKTLRDEGITVLLVEQNAAIALDIANRGYVMEIGTIVLSGTNSELTRDERVKKAYLGA
jgi:branched-chain amino acid transport system ATP-binding protein